MGISGNYLDCKEALCGDPALHEGSEFIVGERVCYHSIQ